MKIFLVEDDSTIAQAVAQHLRAWGYECHVASEFQDILGEFLRVRPQLVLLDLMLPFYNGFHWCREIRRHSKTPVIFLSSASDNMNIVMAVQMGGDDFIAKPFDLNVLAAKVQAMLRRTYDFAAPTDTLSCGPVTLNTAAGTVSNGDRTTDLTRNELRILQVLLENRGRTVSREKLMERLWETDCFVDENTLTVNMTRLRKTLASIGVEHLIVTRKGVGYQIS
ncbi:MAG: response regulator transcription factor [Candidatus Avoscillospira sp.]